MLELIGPSIKLTHIWQMLPRDKIHESRTVSSLMMLDVLDLIAMLNTQPSRSNLDTRTFANIDEKMSLAKSKESAASSSQVHHFTHGSTCWSNDFGDL